MKHPAMLPLHQARRTVGAEVIPVTLAFGQGRKFCNRVDKKGDRATIAHLVGDHAGRVRVIE